MLDPMAGSGTTLVVLRLRGHVAIGFDTDPLARLISSVWCTDINPAAVLRERRRTELGRKSLETNPPGERLSRGADEETRLFVRYWFDLVNRRQLRAIADEISYVREIATRNALWCAFSRLIIAKARRVLRDGPFAQPTAPSPRQGPISTTSELSSSRPHGRRTCSLLRHCHSARGYH